MKRFIQFSFLLILLSNYSFSQQIDSEKSKVVFEVGNMKMRRVKGEFSQLSGSVDLDKNVYGFHICLKAETVNTKNKKRDEHLRTEDFFNVDKFPVICFDSQSFREEKGLVFVLGKLSMLGVTKLVQIQMEINENYISGYFTINRLDFGLGKETNTFLIADEVKIQVTCFVK